MNSNQESLANWIDTVADTWRSGEEGLGQDTGDVPPEVQRNIDDAQLAHELADFVRGLSGEDPLSAALLEQMGALSGEDLVPDGRPAERLRNQILLLRRQLNTVDAKVQAVDAVVRSLLARKQG